jgi:probable HAF family extracellular repeat protein
MRPTVLAAALAGCFLAAPVRADYLAVRLGTLGGEQSAANGVSAGGVVVGWATTPASFSELHPASFSNGTVTDLGTPGVIASGVSPSSRLIVGYADTGHGAFLFSGGTMTDLGTLGGSASRAYAVNDSGQVVGSSTIGSSAFLAHAFLYSGGKMTDLGTLGGLSSGALAINASGQVVGSAVTAGNDAHAFLYSGGKMTDLGTLGGPQSTATGINNAGQIVGYSDTASGRLRAFLYSGGQMTDLGTLGGQASTAAAINASGQVVGDSFTASGDRHGFVFSNGQMTDLQTFLPTDTTWSMSRATGINDAGLISVTAYDESGLAQAFLFVPQAVTDPGPGTPATVPEPGTLALAGFGALLSLVGYRCRRSRSRLAECV